MECSATPGHCIPWISPHGRIGGWTILLDAQGPGNGQNPIYLSHDSGLTWTAQTGGPTNIFGGVALSADGLKIVAVETGNWQGTIAGSKTIWTAQTATTVGGGGYGLRAKPCTMSAAWRGRICTFYAIAVQDVGAVWGFWRLPQGCVRTHRQEHAGTAGRFA